MSDEIAAWERQPNEPYEWFQRFDQYRQMTGKRNILRLYRDERKRDAEREPNEKTRERKRRTAETIRAAPQSFYQMRDEWHWEQRVQAWDEHLRDEKKRTEAEDREKARSARQMMVKALHTLLVNAVKKNQDMIDPRELRELADAAAKIMKESRLEFGEATDIVAGDIATAGQPLPAATNMNIIISQVRDWESRMRDHNND